MRRIPTGTIELSLSGASEVPLGRYTVRIAPFSGAEVDWVVGDIRNSHHGHAKASGNLGNDFRIIIVSNGSNDGLGPLLRVAALEDS